MQSKKPKKKPTRSKLVKQADKVFSEYIRRRYANGFGVASALLVVKRIIGRSFNAVIFNPVNTIQPGGTNKIAKCNVRVVISSVMGNNINSAYILTNNTVITFLKN